jgi:peptidoglycan/LPS O-acetylase OafA/YrhL
MNSQTNLSHLKNRRDIDGLRGLSIILVVCFHSFPEYIPGGFIGVDIFYVISGFLISSLIFKSLEENKFSFLTFYIRRVKRLFPALILVLITVYWIGWYILINSEYINLGKQLVASAVFMNNILLWRDAISYFGEEFFHSSLLQPLLHLWSLGVEEQFYLIWPPLIWLTWKKRRTLFRVLIIIMISSFIFNVYWSTTNIITAFYSPLSRFWEPFIGSYLAYVSIYNPYKLSKVRYLTHEFLNNKIILQHFQSLVGFILIIIAAFTISQDSIFPGWLALLPTLGAYLMIQAGAQSIVNSIFLSNYILVWFGKISYPLYLWHWPVLSFAFLYYFEPPTIYLRITCIFLSIILSWFTYQFIEKPIRFKTKRIFIPIILCLSMLSIGLVGFVTYKFNGFPSRFSTIFKSEPVSKEWREDICFLSHQTHIDKKRCLSKGTGELIFLWGDSYAAALYPGLKQMQEQEHIGLAQFSASACPPIIGYINRNNPNCNLFNNQVVIFIKELKPDIVLLHSTWGYNYASITQLRKTIETLRQMGIMRIILIGPAPNRYYSLQSILFHQYFRINRSVKQLPLYLTDYLIPDFYEKEQKMRDVARQMRIEYISIYDEMCNSYGCLTMIHNKQGNQVITSYDGAHLSPEASIWLVQKIRNSLLKPRKN